MTSPDSITQIAALGLEPTYSAREAAVLLGRSYSWLDQGLRAGQFTNPDGSVLQPLRTPGGYRRFRQSTLRDIALCWSCCWSYDGASSPPAREATTPGTTGTAASTRGATGPTKASQLPGERATCPWVT